MIEILVTGLILGAAAFVVLRRARSRIVAARSAAAHPGCQSCGCSGCPGRNGGPHVSP